VVTVLVNPAVCTDVGVVDAGITAAPPNPGFTVDAMDGVGAANAVAGAAVDAVLEAVDGLIGATRRAGSGMTAI
jgi:hypothetical protein